MKYRTPRSVRDSVSRVLTALVPLALAATLPLGTAAFAQEPPRDLVPLKMTMTASLPHLFTIPVSPPLVVVVNTFTSEDPELGTITYTETTRQRLGVDGRPLSITDGVGAATWTNGDALFVAWSGRVVPATAPFDRQWEGTFTITGGRGRFLGAIGSGVVRGGLNMAKKEVICAMDGMVSRPKP